ncbi:hypothetical protein ABZ863_11685 [Saccharomonospora sp. NPDC046836]|uniref:hypothetical protein n=1 Tax=Saccharomonospora sp. NPDC046836 TaxID=3156921 RepID=UPI0033EC3A34
MKRRFGALLALVVLLLVSFPGMSVAENIDPRIRDFVERVHNKWGLDLNPMDYVVLEDSRGTSITEKSSSSLQVRETAASSGGEVIEYQSSLEISDKSGEHAIAQEPVWKAPRCDARALKTWEGLHIAWLDFCTQWGNMDYAGDPLNHHVVFRGWLTCRSTQNFYAVTACGGGMHRAGPSVWNDWSPKSDLDLPTCRSETLSVTVGPVSASTSYNACERQDMEKGEKVEFMNTWRGKARASDRESAFMVAFHQPKPNSISLYSRTTFEAGICRAIGLDPCADVTPV